MSIESKIKNKALALGFDAVRITTAAPVESAQVKFYKQWLADGRAAKMKYLHHNIEKRFDPSKLLPGARSVICVALNYCPAKTELTDKPNIRIARYAQYEDYHPFIKNRLFQLAEFIGNAGVPPASKNTCDRDGRAPKFKACVDSAPLAERALAQRAGLGFIGKNHMLIHPELGGQILLGELLTTLQLQPDTPLENQSCAGCDRCIQACPTGALAADGSFDARKCISYLTIEAPPETISSPPAKGEYPEGGRGYIFGCDECLLACPYEKNAPPRRNMEFQHHPEWQNLTPNQIQSITEAEFHEIFADSGFIRLGLKRLKHNARIITVHSDS